MIKWDLFLECKDSSAYKIYQNIYCWPTASGGFCIHRFNQSQNKNIFKNPEISKKQNLNLLYTGNYSHNIYMVSNLEMI